MELTFWGAYQNLEDSTKSHELKQTALLPTPIPGHMECDSAPRRNIYSLVTWGQQSSRTPFHLPFRGEGWLVSG